MNRTISQFWLNGARLTLVDAWHAKDAQINRRQPTPDDLLADFDGMSRKQWERFSDRKQKELIHAAYEQAA